MQKMHHIDCILSITVSVPVCEVSEKAGGWRYDSEEDREEVENDLGEVKVEKAWPTKLSAEEEPQWKLWGLRGAEMGKNKPVEDPHPETRQKSGLKHTMASSIKRM